jgi:hypothetical protein
MLIAVNDEGEKDVLGLKTMPLVYFTVLDNNTLRVVSEYYRQQVKSNE